MNDGIKTGIAALTAGLVALGAVISDGITSEEWITVVLALLAGLGGGAAYTQRAHAAEAEAELAVANEEIKALRAAGEPKG